MATKLLHAELTDAIIEAFYYVYNKLGYGFLEKVYENALRKTLQDRGYSVRHRVPVNVFFEGEVVGDYYADLIVNDLVILELKSVEALHSRHEAQLLNYLRATQIEVGLLLNFGEAPALKRRIFTNDRKDFRKGDLG